MTPLFYYTFQHLDTLDGTEILQRCYWDAIEMLLRCCWDAAEMWLRCFSFSISATYRWIWATMKMKNATVIPLEILLTYILIIYAWFWRYIFCCYQIWYLKRIGIKKLYSFHIGMYKTINNFTFIMIAKIPLRIHCSVFLQFLFRSSAFCCRTEFEERLHSSFVKKRSLNVNYECPQNKPGKSRGKKPSKQAASLSSILATAAEDCEGISCNALKLRTSKKIPSSNKH